MLMNRTFFLACATVTLGITAASSAPAYARHCSDLDSDHDRTICYVRSAVYRAEAAYEAKEKRDSPRPTVAKPTCGLTKEYVDGTVKFRDTCTGEWAEQPKP